MAREPSPIFSGDPSRWDQALIVLGLILAVTVMTVADADDPTACSAPIGADPGFIGPMPKP